MATALAAADLDGDGEIEIAASGWCIGNDICCFKRRSGIWDRHIIDSDMAEARAVCFADFNKNGKLDLLATACNGNQVVWYENREGLSWLIESCYMYLVLSNASLSPACLPARACPLHVCM